MEKTREVYRMVDAERGTVIAQRIVRASGWWERLRGLLGRKSLATGEGLWLDPCNGIHTFGMRFPIDVLVLDNSSRVLRIVTGIKPGRVSLPVRGGASVVELPSGTIGRADLAPGDEVRLERADGRLSVDS